jgi:hypothetical protein
MYESATSIIIKVKDKTALPRDLTATDMEAIASQAVRVIERRTAAGKDKDGNAFKGYSQDYIKSDNFAAAGKSQGSVNLRLSGDMLTSLDILKVSNERVVLGFEDDEQRAKAHGHQTGKDGTGQLPVRAFIGLNKDELESAVRRSGVARTLAEAEAITKALEII